MAAIVHQTSKKTGVTYVYESVSFWDKKKHQSRARRKCIGKLDPATKEVIPTKKRQVVPADIKAKQGVVPITKVARSFYGATHLFNEIAKDTGISADLKMCFPDSYKQILSIAYYLILEDKNPLSRFPRWAATHKHPYGTDIPSQRSSELFASISEAEKQHFFKLQGKRRMEKEYLAYDTTSISSYSKSLKQVRYGMNKDHDSLEQINLALLFGQESKLPFYYRKLAGNIPDVKTIKKLLADITALGYDKVKLVLDRGFYSADNINEMYKNHLKFLIAGKLSLKFVRDGLNTVRDEIRNWNKYSHDYGLYTQTLPVSWAYTESRPYKKDTLQSERRMYLHIYFSPERALEDERSLNCLLTSLQKELESGQRNPDHEKLYDKYFTTSTTPVRGTKVTAKDEAIMEAKNNYGFFVLLSNDIKEPIEALEIYRNKDLVEKAFENLKERLNMRRLAVSSDQSLDGKLFVEFIALIILSYIKKKMQDNKLFKDYTMHELLDEFDIIECFEIPGQKIQIGEVTVKQKGLYAQMGVTVPQSLQ
jgi:transposase